jgi:hypothetical protein
MRCSGQLRIAPRGGSIIGIDLDAALSIGAALGYECIAVAELMPAGEAGLVVALNERLREGSER